MLDLNAVDVGFSRKAETYDAYCENHPVIRWARNCVRSEILQRLQPGASILELNAGTGADAAFLAERGYHVHATDISTGMVAAIRKKIQRTTAPTRFTVQQLSFTGLEQTEAGPFDLIFSNFGGLNCIPDLNAVTKKLPNVLKHGGYIVWVIMPPICPWEVAQVLRGQFRVGLRRLHRSGVLANVEGAAIRTWYHSPKEVRAAFPSEFHLVAQRSISLFCPPSYMDRFPHRFSRLTQHLLNLDARLGKYFPFQHWGDFLIYTFQYGH